jgi:hypothetical protein
MILKETLELYRRNGSTVYCTLLDATKAFDRVEYCKLVRLLLIKNLPPIVIRFMLQMYLFHFTQIAWNGILSKRFRVSNGVRQGAILSPILFCVYFDVLLDNLSLSGIGCHIGLFFVGALAYADDLVLLAPSANAMRSMLHVCDVYATQYNVLFNAKKSKCICCHPIGISKRFSRSFCYPSFFIGSQLIEYVEKWPHLGHIISNDCDDSEDLSAKKSSFIGQMNKIICTFPNVNYFTKTKLVKSYCTSFYGAELWDLSHSDIETLCIAWRKGIRRLYQLPYTTHSALIPGLCDTLPLTDLLYKRMLNFVYRCLNSHSLLVNFITRHGILAGQMYSVLGRNVINCSQRYSTSIDSISKSAFSPVNINRHAIATQDDMNTSALLQELLHCRDGSFSLSNKNFNNSDVTAMIDILCTC